mmetsp:Transcript_24958/g.54435  ORF Transcript_24958/g.54435 Transcript_24958/m.54435 type:complete len:94 (+) Transcript_24958:455-736(+)
MRSPSKSTASLSTVFSTHLLMVSGRYWIWDTLYASCENGDMKACSYFFGCMDTQETFGDGSECVAVAAIPRSALTPKEAFAIGRKGTRSTRGQ